MGVWFCAFRGAAEDLLLMGGFVAGAWSLPDAQCAQLLQSCPDSLGPCQALLSMLFSRQEYWSGLPFPSSWYLHNLGIGLG